LQPLVLRGDPAMAQQPSTYRMLAVSSFVVKTMEQATILMLLLELQMPLVVQLEIM
jgi:hypothetical protein